MSIVAFDHVAIPIQKVDAMLSFYRALGFEVREEHAPILWSVHFGDQKINFHGPKLWESSQFTLRGPTAKPGCGDFCFVWDGAVKTLEERLRSMELPIEEGPVTRRGARDAGHTEGTSIYVRDPDNNLLEFMVYEDHSE